MNDEKIKTWYTFDPGELLIDLLMLENERLKNKIKELEQKLEYVEFEWEEATR